MTPWQQLNSSVWQRVYADGTVGIVRGESDFVVNEIDTDGRLQLCVRDLPEVSKLNRFGLMDALDAKHDPQPELIERGDDWTFYRHGKRGAMAELAHGFWWVNIPLEYSQRYDTREQAEAAARRFVMEGKS